MAWLYYAAAIFLTIGVMGTILNVGKPREPLTGGTAAASTIISAGIITLLILATL